MAGNMGKEGESVGDGEEPSKGGNWIKWEQRNSWVVLP